MNFFFRTPGILDGEETAHQLADDDRGSLENLLLRGNVGRDAELRTELVGDGAEHFIAGYLTDHI